MIPPKPLRFHQIRILFNLPHLNPKPHSIPSIHTKSSIPTSIFSRTISLSSQFQHKESNQNSKKPLTSLFTEAIGLSKTDTENDEDEQKKLHKNLTKLATSLRSYNNDSSKETDTSPITLSKPLETLFTEAVGLSKRGQESEIDEIENDGEESKKGLTKLSILFMGSDRRGESRTEGKIVEESMDLKELSPEMGVFASYLYSKGYLRNANFVSKNKFDVSCFENKHGRDYLKFAAESFAKDHREIQKWLPGSDLKKVAEFGCPSLGRKTVFSAKAMRLFYGIREETVCNKCVLKDSCKFVNQSVWKKGAKIMDLTTVMRVVTLYALKAVPTRLEVPDELNNAINRLLKEVVRLSKLES